VRADARRHADRELQAGVGAAAAVGAVAPVEQHGGARPPRPFLQPHHQLVVPRGAAPVHPAHLVAVPVGAHQHVRAALALVGERRAGGALARAERRGQAGERDDPGQHGEPVGRGDRALELGQHERVGGAHREGADGVHPAQRRP
jgi:hypothetical protein